MRVIRHDVGLAATVFFWPVRKPILTHPTAQPMQDLSDFIESAQHTCQVETTEQQGEFFTLDATNMAKCLYTAVERTFREPRGFAVTSSYSRTDVFYTPQGHLLMNDQHGAWFRARTLYERITLWCLY